MNGAGVIRYGGGPFDFRKAFIRTCARLQRKQVVILDKDPELCAEVLAGSETKGTFLEHLIAIPAWRPIRSIESEDGARWKELASHSRTILHNLRWKDRVSPLVAKHVSLLGEGTIGAEQVSTLALQVLVELLFEQPLSPTDAQLFYRASVEWRKEIGVKGRADLNVKEVFCRRLTELLRDSQYGAGVGEHASDPQVWLSVFAQPFIISPQINVSDVMVAVFKCLTADQGQFAEAKRRTAAGDDAYLDAVIMESMRLAHPFPILERELRVPMTFDGETYPPGTQVLITLDRFVQDPTFNPQSWLSLGSKHPFHPLLFGAGQRVCLGKALAKALMLEMLRAFLPLEPAQRLQPSLGHLHSGRHNDSQQSLQESLYQLRVFSRALWRSHLIGRR